MLRTRYGFAVVAVILLSPPAGAAPLDVLQGKFAFNWFANLSREKCVKVDGPFLADFKSARYRCKLNPVSNTSSGARARVCTSANGRKEYLIFETLRACAGERKTQESNE